MSKLNLFKVHPERQRMIFGCCESETQLQKNPICLPSCKWVLWMKQQIHHPLEESNLNSRKQTAPNHINLEAPWVNYKFVDMG